MKKITDEAFSECAGLTRINIPESMEEIGRWAFGNCDSLQDVYFGGGSGQWKEIISRNKTYINAEIHYAKEYETSEFEYELLDDGTIKITRYVGYEENLDIPSEIDGKKVTAVGAVMTDKEGFWGENLYEGGFQEHQSLKSVTIPDGVTIIGGGVFYGCKGLESVSIPESVTIIGEAAFYDCEGLKNIIIPEGVKAIEEWAFYGCRGLQSADIPDSVTTIEYSAFAYCINMKSLNIGRSVTEIGGSAFRDCHSLTSIEFPDSLQKIGEIAFIYCKCLNSITIHDSIQKIDGSAFKECKQLKDVYFLGSETQWKSIDIGIYKELLPNATIHYNLEISEEVSEKSQAENSQAENSLVTENKTDSNTNTIIISVVISVVALSGVILSVVIFLQKERRTKNEND